MTDRCVRGDEHWQGAPRFFIDSLSGDKSAVLTGEEAHHAARVLRLSPGDRAILIDQSGWEYLGQVQEVQSSPEPVVSLAALGRVWAATEPPFEVYLMQGLPKGDKMDLIVQKGTEVGITRFLPVSTERSVVRYTAAKADRRRERWQKIAREAVKQSRRAVIPGVDGPTDLAGALDAAGEGVRWLLFWEGATLPLKKVLRNLTRELSEARTLSALGPIGIIVGPEGGLAPDEVDFFVNRGASLVSLGPRILRTETAGTVAAALILYELTPVD